MSGVWRKIKRSLSVKPSSSSSSRRHQSSTSHSTTSSSLCISHGHSFTVESSKKTCAICLGSLRTKHGQAIFTAECSHSFHFKCIADNVKHGNRICPLCRYEWKDIPFQAPIDPTEALHNNSVISQVSQFTASPESVHGSQTPTEPAIFNDDERLPEISRNIASSSNNSPQALLTIKTFPELPAISASDSSSKFGALVRVRAPPLGEDAQNLDHRAPIDLVAVLDVSGSMRSKLPLLKRAVQFIIQNLGPSDRLAVVVFNVTAWRIFPLRRMSRVGCEDAIHVIDSLTCSGGTNIVEGLIKGVRVLEERQAHNPVSSIILLSDGQDTLNVGNMSMSLQNQTNGNSRAKLEYLDLLPASIKGEHRVDSQQSAIPVHTFGFGSEHDSTAMYAIADVSHGTYSSIESIGILQDAFARCIGGLLSVVAQNVQLTINTATKNVKIKSAPSGKYKSEILDNKRKVVINIGDLYADEEKDFLLFISVPISAVERTSLLNVLCSYKDFSSMEKSEVKGDEISIRRPKILSSEDKIICLEVDRQKNRLLVAEAISNAQQMAERDDFEGAKRLLTEKKETLLSSPSAQEGDPLCNSLQVELTEIIRRMEDEHSYRHSGRPYILSGLISHSWQRAATRGGSETQVMEGGGTTTTYETPSMVNMVSRSQILNSEIMQRHNSSRANKSGKV
ncbi:hypothetical protein ACFE04_031111 [Oxalis oulophora]